MTARALADAVLALAPDGAVLGEVVDDELPWTSVRVRAPGVVDRSDAATAQGRSVRVQITCAGATDESALVALDTALASLEGARPVAAGWVTGPLLLLGNPNLYSDDLMLTGVNRRVAVAVASLEFTASPI